MSEPSTIPVLPRSYAPPRITSTREHLVPAADHLWRVQENDSGKVLGHLRVLTDPLGLRYRAEIDGAQQKLVARVLAVLLWSSMAIELMNHPRCCGSTFRRDRRASDGGDRSEVTEVAIAPRGATMSRGSAASPPPAWQENVPVRRHATAECGWHRLLRSCSLAPVNTI